MDATSCQIVFIDDNEVSLREQILSKIIAAALLEKIQIHTGNTNKNTNNTKES